MTSTYREQDYQPTVRSVEPQITVDGFRQTVAAIEQEVHHLTIGMSWLPFLAAAVAAWAGTRFVRRRPPPFSDSWAVDLALLAATTALGLRAYNAFTGEGSYAPYYAAPLVLLAGLLHQRVADRWPAARSAVLAALGAVALGLALYALVGLYADRTTPVRTARGTYIADERSAPAIQAAVDVVGETTGPGDAILAAPSDGGLYFMTARRPALPELMLLPGLLDSPADELAAVRALQREHVGLAVVGARDFTPFGSRTFGVDYNRRLGAWLREEAASTLVLGDLGAPAAGTYPSRGFEVLALLPPVAARLPAAAALQDANTVHTAPKPAMRTIERPSGLRLISQAAVVPRSPSAIIFTPLHRTAAKAAPSRQAGRALVAATVAAAALVSSEGRVEAAPRPIVVDSVSELQAAVRRAPNGGTVYVRGGSYGSALLSGSRTGWVTIRPSSGASVFFADLNFSPTASYMRVRRVRVNGQVDLAPEGAHHIQILDSNLRGVSAKWGTHHLLIEHNSIHDCDNCVELVSTAANVPGAPDPNATDLPPVRYVTIRGNRIARPSTDALFLTNFRQVVVEGNEITGVIENGSHNDTLQTVWGGDGLVFRGNYVHDNRGQGFFIKDGRVSDVVVANNLFVRVSGPFWQIQLYRTIGAVIARNTVWNVQAPVVLQENDNRGLIVRNNVFNGMVVEAGYESDYRDPAVLNQYRNVITGGWNWGAQSRDRSVRPQFRAPARNDFRLTKTQVSRLGFGAGVTWRRAGRVFGPR